MNRSRLMSRCWTAIKNISGGVLDTGWISSGVSFVRRFEEGMAVVIGRKHGIAVCNGTVA